MTAKRVVLWRHGQTDWNNDGRFQGQADVPLNATGLAQAAAAAPHLAAMEPVRLVSSNLSRARDTAAALAELTGLPVEPDSRLQEINVGTWAGLDMATVATMEPDFEAALREGRDFRRSTAGETATESGERVATVLRELASGAGDGSTVVAVGHGLSLRVAAMLLIGLDYSHARRFGGMWNCGWTVLQPHTGWWRMIHYNSVA